MKSFRDMPERDETGWQRDQRLNDYEPDVPVDFEELRSREQLAALGGASGVDFPPPSLGGSSERPLELTGCRSLNSNAGRVSWRPGRPSPEENR